MERQWKGGENPREKAVKRQWKVEERQWKVVGRSWEGSGKAVKRSAERQWKRQ